MLQRFAYARPDRLSDAVERLARGNATIHAGGTDLLGCLREQVFATDTLVSLASIEGLSGIQDSGDGGLRIGAMTPLSELAGHPQVRSRYPGLAQAAAEVGSPQLRHQGTLGGNLCQKPRCWYYRGDFDCLRKGGNRCFALAGENQYHCIFGGANCFIVHPSDCAPALVALDAELQVVGGRGRRRLAAADFHMPPIEDPGRETVLEADEILVEIRLPPPAEGLYNSYRKIRTRRAWDFAIAGCALALTMEGRTVRDSRVVLAGAAPVPWRSQATEQVLQGRALDEKVIAEAAEAVIANAEPMSGNAYKLPLFRGMMIEELRKAAAA